MHAHRRFLAGLLCCAGCRLDLAPEDLRIDAEATTVVTKSASDSAAVTVRTSTRNPYPWPARVHVGGPPYLVVGRLSSPSGIGFTYEMYRIPPGRSRLHKPDEGYTSVAGGRTWGQPDFLFGPWQRLTYVVTVPVNGRRAPGNIVRDSIPPGEYLMVVGFAHHAPVRLPVTVRP